MENHSIVVKRSSIRRKGGTQKKTMNEIFKEYSLKENLFDPKKSSPNNFQTRLHIRMKQYYKEIYNSFNFNKK